MEKKLKGMEEKLKGQYYWHPKTQHPKLSSL